MTTPIVLKFGGSSVGDIERIKNVANIVSRAYHRGEKAVVVVSAMQGETDRLIQLATEGAIRPSGREYDRLIATGECVSAALLAITLQNHGIEAVSLSGREAGIHTSNNHQTAIITHIDSKQIKKLLSENKLPIITGFQGINQFNETTTLGRGGSDVTAVALAAALSARECQVYTDVSGVFTSDPRIVTDAKLLPQISYSEMLALASLGAKVMQEQAVSYAKKHSVHVRVLSSFNEGPGTLICDRDNIVQPWVSGVAFDQSQAKLSILGIPKIPGALEQLQEAMLAANFAIDMSVENMSSPKTMDYSFTVHMNDYHHAVDFTNQIAKSISAQEVSINNEIAKLSLVGMGMKSHAGVASKIFQTLGSQGIDIYLIASTEAKISTIIDKKHLEIGANLLHRAFHLNQFSNAPTIS